MDIQTKIALLKSKGWTQADIAQAAKIGQGTVSKLLTGVHGPRLSTYRAIMALKGRKK